MSKPAFSPYAVEFQDYSLSFGFTYLLEKVTFGLKWGESMAVIGPAGSGKSMLLNVLSQVIWESAFQPEYLTQSGVCRILGYQVTPKKPTHSTLEVLQSRIALIDDKSAWLPLSISENFAVSQSLTGVASPLSYLDIIEQLPLSPGNRARLASIAEYFPAQIEPPLLQQLAIIRALLRKPSLVLLDDPFLRMDPVLLKQTENLVLKMAGEATVIWATNDLHQASRMTDWIVLVRNGRVVECTETPQFFTHPQTREAENFIAGRDEDL